ncbi:MAG: LLM class flavin-dependent oxidoreductase [Dehalococcoidia bacterium]
MEIGIAFPKIIPGGRSERVMEWAIRADEGPFSSLALIDRLVYGTHESLIVLAAAAAVTERIRLMPTVLIAPLRNAALLAKQVATIDAISGGRFSLGLGVGSRPDDFAAVNVPMKARGKLMEEQIATMRRIWSGLPVNDEAGPMGPAPARPGGPEILIGGRSPIALERAGRLGDGYISGSAGSALTNQVKEVGGYYDAVFESWKAQGKPGRPRLVVGMTCGMGAYAAERARESMRAYYSFRGPSAQTMEVNLPSTPDELREAISAFEGIGADEIILEPGVGDLDQLDRLAEAIG